MLGSSSVNTLRRKVQDRVHDAQEGDSGQSLQSSLHGARPDSSSNSRAQKFYEEFGSSLHSLSHSRSATSQSPMQGKRIPS